MIAAAASGWPPVVVASVYQTGLNLMRDLLRRGVRTVGVDCEPTHQGFRSRYGTSHLCPNPDTHPDQWIAFMVDLATQLGTHTGVKPVIIPAADIFVAAIARHADILRHHYIFSLDAIAVQAALATKEQQYALARQHGLPIPRTAYIQSLPDIQSFAAQARFPCLIKPRHQREWDVLPPDNILRGRKLITAHNAAQLVAHYALTQPYRPEVVVQEIIAGPDDTKYCYLSVYGHGSRRLGSCVVRELRAYPIHFGSGSIVQPVLDPEIDTLCHHFLTAIGYVGICEIEVKRDTRDGIVRLIEANPRYSVTADAAIYAGVDIAWLNYLDLIGTQFTGHPPAPVQPTHFAFKHIVLGRDIPAIPQYLQRGLLTWGQILRSWGGPLKFFDFDLRDPRPTATTVLSCLRVLAGTLLRALHLKKPLPTD